jgi:hypothetical protein
MTQSPDCTAYVCTFKAPNKQILMLGKKFSYNSTPRQGKFSVVTADLNSPIYAA